MPIDPENLVAKLCVEGMQAEAEGRFADARACFEQAWAARQNDLDACIAAHYQARHQETLERILHWNQEALRYADTVSADAITGKGEEITAFYPSLYLNLGKSYEDLGDSATARHYYELAEEKAALLAGEYGDIVRGGISSGLQRTSDN
jgi:tetratricopeptide (TPR) repeat protein